MKRPPSTAALLATALTLACALQPAPASAPAEHAPEPREASGPSPRWSYEIAVDDALEHMQLALCIEGPRPIYLQAPRGAMSFVDSARVRGGDALERDGSGFVVETLGEHGCLDLEIDLAAAARASGRDSARRGDSIMVAPDRWLWCPGLVPDEVEARARFDLPEGVTATVPWPHLEDGWRRLDHTSFGWNAWIAFGHYQPIEFTVGECEFEVAVLDGERAATDAGIERWLRVAAESSVELYGRFPRDRVSLVVIPTSGWRDSAVMFGMARRGGGGSAMLLLNEDARDDELPGEWVASHELLHLGMPLIDDPWMSEGFVTYYTQILRARQGVLAASANRDEQARAALLALREGFRRARGGTRTLAKASDNMRRSGGYTRVYWGGAAVAFDLDRSIRAATEGRRSLDDLMILLAELAPVHRHWQAEDLIARMEAEVERWREAGELRVEISPSKIVERHLRAKSLPADIADLDGLAVDIKGSSLRLLANPNDEVRVRASLFDDTRSP
ncbi:hypothetical protein [Enhygromyxa salina]|uniref:hypothetical protein n=1 Tax=Enhygromyxa salina TaxID=215803 RepID=UPI000D097926|nr:hypothetical protein [Enhygromyxa salina]